VNDIIHEVEKQSTASAAGGAGRRYRVLAGEMKAERWCSGRFRAGEGPGRARPGREGARGRRVAGPGETEEAGRGPRNVPTWGSAPRRGPRAAERATLAADRHQRGAATAAQIAEAGGPRGRGAPEAAELSRGWSRCRARAARREEEGRLRDERDARSRTRRRPRPTCAMRRTARPRPSRIRKPRASRRWTCWGGWPRCRTRASP
jgi:hypothetical protein